MDIYVFMDTSLQLSMLLWISIKISLDFHGYPCKDLLWNLDPGSPCRPVSLGGSGLISTVAFPASVVF